MEPEDEVMEVEDQEVEETPEVTPPPVIPTDEQMEAWANQRGYVKPQPAPVEPGTDPRIAQREKLLADAENCYGEDRIRMTREALALTEEIAADKAAARMQQMYAPLQQTYVPNIVGKISADPYEQEFLSQQLSGYPPQEVDKILKDEKLKDLLKRGARDYANEKKSVQLTNESAQSEKLVTTASDLREIQDFEKAMKLKPGTLSKDKQFIRDAKYFAAKMGGSQ